MIMSWNGVLEDTAQHGIQGFLLLVAMVNKEEK